MKYLIWAVAILIIVAGAYFAYDMYFSGAQNGETPAGGDANATTTPTGDQVQAQEVEVGEGALAEPGTRVSVLYVGRLEDGTVFDSSAAHGNEPLEFVLGATEGDIVPIAGFQIGVNGMRVGGERILAIPPSLAYGDQAVTDAEGNVVIPANSTIIFNVQLVDVQQVEETQE